MDNKLLKTGACSVVLGSFHYKDFFPSRENKLLKVTKSNSSHDEFKYLSIVRSIPNYSRYFCIPDEVSYLIKPSDSFYTHIDKLTLDHNVNIFYGNINCTYIDNAGDKELFDTMTELFELNDYSYWKTYDMILDFTKTMLSALSFLHEKKMCHLDIKPENIIVNTKTKQYKIIDFGFSSIEPFDDYVENVKGTPGYFPRNFIEYQSTSWLPRVHTNDMKLIKDKLPMVINRKLVYKIDSYCLGRVLNFLKYVFDHNNPVKDKKNSSKLSKIIEDLLKYDVNKRPTVKDALTKYFS